MLSLEFFMKVHVVHIPPTGGGFSQMNPSAKMQEKEEVEQNHF